MIDCTSYSFSFSVAHSEVYGYGFRTFEFLPLAKGGNLYQQKEQQLGMYALRSPLYPRFYVIVSWMTSLFGCSAAPYLVRWAGLNFCFLYKRNLITAHRFVHLTLLEIVLSSSAVTVIRIASVSYAIVII